MHLNGSDILLECLLEQGVDTVFGYPGGTILNVYDALYKYSDKIKHYLTSHEQGASHAADGYARSSGKVGVCLATSGPGATNLVTGIATAYMDSVPIVAITCNVSKALLGKDSFQEIDIAGVTMPITKHNFIVKDINDLSKTIRRAFYIAKEGRPGPVLVDITKDVTAAMCEYVYGKPKEIKRKTETIKEEDINSAIKLINECERPFIIAGGGVISSDCSKELEQFVEIIDAPIALTTMGIGGFKASSPRFTGMIGMHGNKASNLLAMSCDLLIVLGARFSDRVTGKADGFAPVAKILHIDIDPAEINKNANSESNIVGDLKEILTILNKKLNKLSNKAWNDDALSLKAEYPYKYPQDDVLRPQFVLEKISELTKGDSIICTDVGQHQMFACQYVKHEKPRHWVTSGGLGTMGFGIGAAIGANIANPEKVVFNITGDGCFRMNNIELATAVEYNIPIIVVITNNHALGMVVQWQKFFYDERYSQTLLGKTTDFHLLTEAYKAKAYTITKKEEVESVLKEAISLRRPVVINVELVGNDLVFPMIPAGKVIGEFFGEDVDV